jgi:hypothetical protein
VTASLFLLLIVRQGKIAPVSAVQLVRKSSSCVLVGPQSPDGKIRVIRNLWGSDVKPGNRIALRGYTYSDTVGGPPASEFMLYSVPERAIAFLQPPPARLRLASGQRFAELPMIPFGKSLQICRIERTELMVGQVLFDPSMRRSHAKSVSLEEIVKELRRIRASVSTSKSKT